MRNFRLKDVTEQSERNPWRSLGKRWRWYKKLCLKGNTISIAFCVLYVLALRLALWKGVRANINQTWALNNPRLYNQISKLTSIWRIVNCKFAITNNHKFPHYDWILTSFSSKGVVLSLLTLCLCGFIKFCVLALRLALWNGVGVIRP